MVSIELSERHIWTWIIDILVTSAERDRYRSPEAACTLMRLAQQHWNKDLGVREPQSVQDEWDKNDISLVQSLWDSARDHRDRGFDDAALALLHSAQYFWRASLCIPKPEWEQPECPICCTQFKEEEAYRHGKCAPICLDCKNKWTRTRQTCPTCPFCRGRINDLHHHADLDDELDDSDYEIDYSQQ
ncbi:uncharacterized protein K489DRAFT_372952 [Dissoconium aciculare CBS 342.82]|uniref:RING-type domain-containing protein n=1 Tax=Dissoconium aciculare CBS 342.82 TaxID=1314786 RepID=A0A6J3LVJ8_9PEZI|nr:uncharacterized protein K489DRAFT_372952 [Dissoconium aciculare CBS 342.82]KAF1819703.1 hypothetical protein K489DRAFT_372952 [Dissoconium aciculare CBS 342.82]